MLIIGAPGFGKTTVTKMTAQKSKGTKTGKLLFCRLPRKETFNEVATEMTHSSRKLPSVTTTRESRILAGVNKSEANSQCWFLTMQMVL